MPERERVKDHNAKDARRRVEELEIIILSPNLGEAIALLNREAEEVVFGEWRRQYAYEKVLAINPIFEKLYVAYEVAYEATAFASSE